jgi:lipopolysaccharide transport system permease protein
MAEISAQPEYEIVIEPSHGWLAVRWRELWEYRDLLYLLVQRDFLAKYKQTILGPLWFILQPLLTTAIFVLIFTRVAQLPTDGIPAPLFFLCGLVIWNYFAQSVSSGSATFTTNAHIFGKVYFPRLIMPAATVLSNLASFALQLLPFAAMFAWYRLATPFGPELQLSRRMLYMPLLLAQTSLFAFGVSLWLSAASAKYRDLVHLNAFLLQLWMFATPVILPLSRFPKSLGWLVWLNPMAPVVEAFRIALLGRGTLDPGALLASVCLTLFVTFTGIAVFQRSARTAMDHV